ncbi:MAG: hypothetical protein ACK5M3_13210 [Dysgonomonas sp.]
MSDEQIVTGQRPDQNSNQNSSQTVIFQQESRQTNGIGTAGFVLALLAIFLFWVPVLDFILWILGLIFSLVGVFRQPKGLAIAGLVLSLIVIILILFVAGALATAIGLSL